MVGESGQIGQYVMSLVVAVNNKEQDHATIQNLNTVDWTVVDLPRKHDFVRRHHAQVLGPIQLEYVVRSERLKLWTNVQQPNFQTINMTIMLSMQTTGHMLYCSI